VSVFFQWKGGENMDISNMKAAESRRDEPITKIQSTDSLSKSIQNKISGAQRKMRELSSKEDISAEEKKKKRQELQQEINSLNTQLKQRQVELNRKQKMGTQNKEENDENAVKDTKAATPPSPTGIHSAITADFSMIQARSQRMVTARFESGVGILESEIRQDKARGTDVTKKREELAQHRKKAKRSATSQLFFLGKARRAIRAARQERLEKAEGKSKVKSQKEIEAKILPKNTNFSKERRQAAQRQFSVSMDVRV